MNKQNAEETKLETRFCISTDSPCALCHRRNIRTVGTTETYLAWAETYRDWEERHPDWARSPALVERYLAKTERYLARTDDWVCYDCAFGIDPELAEFAYYPERYRRLDHTPFQYDCWGVCPECGSPADEDFDVGKALNLVDHYFICLRHGVCWCVGSNIFSGWWGRPQSLLDANAEILKRFREVEPCTFPDPKRLADMVCDLKAWRPLAVKAGNTTLVEMTDHACLTRDTDELEAVRQLYNEEFSAEELGLDDAEIPFRSPGTARRMKILNQRNIEPAEAA